MIGERKKKRHGRHRANPWQDPYKSSNENTQEAIKKVYGLQCNREPIEEVMD
jgi:hypothetical protein